MKKIIVLISVFVKLECLAQQKVRADTLARIIENINNSSVFIAYNYFETIHLDQKALTLCNNLSNSLATSMINELNNKEKVLVFHIILSKSTEPGKTKFKSVYHYAGDKIDYTTYTFNNFS